MAKKKKKTHNIQKNNSQKQNIEVKNELKKENDVDKKINKKVENISNKKIENNLKNKTKEEEIVFKDVKSVKKTIAAPQGAKKNVDEKDIKSASNNNQKNNNQKSNNQKSNNQKSNNQKSNNQNINNQKKNVEIKEKTKKDIKTENKLEKNKEINKEIKRISNNAKQDKEIENKAKLNIKTSIKKEDFSENKEKKKRKALYVVFAIFTILSILLCFSTIFAILGSFKVTFARGLKINGVDVSNLTYEEAKNKLNEVIEIQSLQPIDLIYKDYKYTIKLEDINYEYDLLTALNSAYNVGKDGNIIENNYSLIKTALFGENIQINISYDEILLDAIIDIIDTNIPGRVKQYSYYIEGTNLIINPGVDGIIVEKDELKNMILTSIQNRFYSDILDNYNPVEIEIPYLEITADKIDARKIEKEVYKDPQNAYYVEETDTTDFEIYPAKDGVSLAITAEEVQNMVDSEFKEEYIVPLAITPAEIQLKDIGVEAFPYKVQTFSTSYDASNYGRSKNLEIAANKINGTVLMPGEEFSFNNVVGERTVAEGYKNATIYSNGQVVDGLAGGICQISSTLYNAVLLSNLEIVERFNHSFTTSYVAAGRDATVVYGVKDFKFRNSRKYPIKIEASVANGIATISIYGVKEENEYTVKIIPKTTQTIPYSTQTVIDTTLAPGTMKVTQAGASGRKVTTYKETYLNGILVSNEVISNDVYQVMTRIVRANPVVETVVGTEEQVMP